MEISNIYEEFMCNYKDYGFSKGFGHTVANFIDSSATWCHDGSKTKIKKDLANKVNCCLPEVKEDWKNAYLVFVRLLEK